MQDVIRRIIKIETSAQTIIANANKEKEDKKREFDDNLAALEKRIIGDAKKKIDQIRERELSENETKKEQEAVLCERKLVEMEKRVRENKDVWVQELVNNVLKR